jgi:hypothetical protein
MITKVTSEAMLAAYREIETCEAMLRAIELLKNMQTEPERMCADPKEPIPSESFGLFRVRQLQLGIPSGNNERLMFNVSPSLAEAVIRQHMGNKRSELVEANERARIELGSGRMQ